MGGALGLGTPTFNPTQAGLFGNPWISGIGSGVGGGALGLQSPQVLQALQQLLHIQYAEQQQIQQLAYLVPQQLQLIQQLIQIVAHQQPHPFFSTSSLTGPSGWLGTQTSQPPIFGGQPGYVM
jgi:hypothetical protein